MPSRSHGGHLPGPTSTGLGDSPSAPPSSSPSVSNTTPASRATELARPVLWRLDPVTRAGLGERRRSDQGGQPDRGRRVYSGSVIDVGTGKALFAHRAGAAQIPASINKILTSAAVLSVLGSGAPLQHDGGESGKKHDHPGRRRRPVPGPQDTSGISGAGFRRGPGEEDRGRAEEAKATSRSRLGYDATLFSGPAWNPTWPTGYADQVSRPRPCGWTRAAGRRLARDRGPATRPGRPPRPSPPP